MKGGCSMNFVDPLGRNSDNGPTPRACMCPVEGGFAAITKQLKRMPGGI